MYLLVIIDTSRSGLSYYIIFNSVTFMEPRIVRSKKRHVCVCLKKEDSGYIFSILNGIFEVLSVVSKITEDVMWS